MAVAATILPSSTYQLHLRQLETTTTEITEMVQTTAASACCPLCGRLASRVHAHYVRSVTDVP